MIIEKNPGYMSKEEVKERLEELQSIKIHPKDEDANRHLIERGERLYEETIGDYRRLIDEGIRKFEEALDKQDKRIIETEYENLKNLLNDIEGEIEY